MDKKKLLKEQIQEELWEDRRRAEKNKELKGKIVAILHKYSTEEDD